MNQLNDFNYYPSSFSFSVVTENNFRFKFNTECAYDISRLLKEYAEIRVHIARNKDNSLEDTLEDEDTPTMFGQLEKIEK
jgi:hypothetical protein